MRQGVCWDSLVVGMLLLSFLGASHVDSVPPNVRIDVAFRN